ncbi:MAG: hypothetical protein A2087_04505 [Spirochaetes bacterium GWD1_61_31]|nr:MAG: hypothetical protein A2Y37_06390 [Spirochaetes bacterium GWB1_60_80]OHD33450.1 MAG: hypothetical protein A2004_06195 [Spirochaetes bacterium GWC1_61_12]OHD40579.1 MAG: hypothetical protein A2087_04505 [Spirochaetes bacterium GWD1_61_31]OHD59290.1 MAG: hypothetical protein A2Y32_09830 [Spirochaetes bacterium GWF1_60_12]HAP44585.1 hypothetical protein [Spirochaetaceae bacterium]
MVCIVSIKEGANGIVSIGTATGSLFRSRSEYFRLAFQASGLTELAELVSAGLPAGGLTPRPGQIEAPEDGLEGAVNALGAERAACALLARAEQCRSGLNLKLVRRKLDAWAVQVALDRLEALGLLDDSRYAAAWIRQRVRRHAEGPRSLQAALGRRGVAAIAVRQALAENLAGSARRQALQVAAAILGRKHGNGVALDFRLRGLGYSGSEIAAWREESA